MGPHPPVHPAKDAVFVRELRAYVIASKDVEEEAGGGGDCHAQIGKHWIVDTPIANPSSVHAELKRNRKLWGIDALGTVLVQVELSNGIIGLGTSIGGEPACYIIEQHLARFVEGQDPRNIELIWDQMYRATVNYGRKGLPIQAISAVDLALWDALGKLRNEPVYQLLGGKTKELLPVYCTTARPDLAKSMGFKGAKIPLPYGPADGDAGMRANIDRIKAARALVGEDFPLMIDCYMALTPTYVVELARRIDREVPNGVKWIEEFLPPDDYQGYAEVKRRVSTTLLTTGEHEYTRHGFRRLLEMNCCDVLQPDITWCGGITEARRIVALADAYGVSVIPHGSSVFSFHLQYAYMNCPLAECINLSPEADKIVPYFGGLFIDEPLPVDGYIALPHDKPGFGVTLNPALKLRRPYERKLGSETPPRSLPLMSQAEWLTDPLLETYKRVASEAAAEESRKKSKM